MSAQQVDGARTRIVRRANDAFLAHGYGDLTMSQLAQICGLTRRALYHHFSSKEDVFRAVVRLNTLAATEAADRAAAAHGTKQRILIRINPATHPARSGISFSTRASQFGIDEEVLNEAIDRIEYPGLNLDHLLISLKH